LEKKIFSNKQLGFRKIRDLPLKDLDTQLDVQVKSSVDGRSEGVLEPQKDAQSFFFHHISFIIE